MRPFIHVPIRPMITRSGVLMAKAVQQMAAPANVTDVPRLTPGVLIDNLCQNIEPTGRSVDAEKNTLRSTQNQHETEQVEPRIGNNAVAGKVLGEHRF